MFGTCAKMNDNFAIAYYVIEPKWIMRIYKETRSWSLSLEKAELKLITHMGKLREVKVSKKGNLGSMI